MKRRHFIKNLSLISAGLLLPSFTYAKEYLSIEQAKLVLFPDEKLTAIPVELSNQQRKSIKKSSKVRVNQSVVKAWKTPSNQWFIVDQVIGKHENIDVAYALSASGEVKGVEILTYRESYGHQIINPKWRKQFLNWGLGKSKDNRLKLDREIKNISGATLSCQHITQGVTRIVHTWDQVLRHL